MTSDLPVIMSAPMVQACLDDSKTMTRRLAWGRQSNWMALGGRCISTDPMSFENPSRWQRVKVGDRLWVREMHSFRNCTDADDIQRRISRGQDPTLYSTDRTDKYKKFKWRPSIHMPRWASRLTLVVTATKIERLQDISEADATAEGAEIFYGPPFDPAHAPTNRRRFELLWRHLHGPKAWDANPEVVAVSFRVHKCNVDQMPGAA